MKQPSYKGPTNITLREFVEKTFLPWAKNEKKSCKNDYSRSKPILSYFKNKRMREIIQMFVQWAGSITCDSKR
jgi:hypothetical protein